MRDSGIMIQSRVSVADGSMRSPPALDHAIAVLKFGSSVLTAAEAMPAAIHEIYRHLRQGHRVVAVVSALGKTTDRLLAQAASTAERPPDAALAALLATGEAAAAALLAMSLDRSGIPATLLDPSRVGLRTSGPLLDAEPCGLDKDMLLRALGERPVAVLGGFVGQDAAGSTSLLGRGGSDLTAIFIAHQLRARVCRLIKDVAGIYRRDPAGTAPLAERFAAISWEDAVRLATGAVQAKALAYARRHQVSFQVGALDRCAPTIIGAAPTRLAQCDPQCPPLRVALLGLGTVGLGVYRHLAANPSCFEVAGIAVRDPAKHRHEDVPPRLLCRDPWHVLSLPSDLVIEAIGGEHPAAGLVEAAVKSGRDVITANKAVMAVHGSRLQRLAGVSGRELRASATVGGGMPVLEAITRIARGAKIRRVAGVLNATTTFILDQIAQGSDMAAAIRLAQQNGFAEAQPGADLDGTDAAHKLVIVARAAFGVELDRSRLPVCGIDRLTPQEVRAARDAGLEVRLVATCSNGEQGVAAAVEPLALASDHPLAGTRGGENKAIVETVGGELTVISGIGAGRWPTSESVLADVLDLFRLRRWQVETVRPPQDAAVQQR
jgi:homoserine dehydrogenase